MPERETSILDMMLRHNLYLQGLKRGMGSELSRIVVDLDREIRNLFGRVNVKVLAELPKRDFDRLMARLRRDVNKVYVRHLTKFIRETKQFVGVEISTLQRVFRSDTGQRNRAPELANVWAKVQRSTNAATGMNLAQGATAYRNAGLTNIERTIRRGYTAKLETIDIMRNVVGVQSRNYQDGVLKRIPAWSMSFAGTTVQHASGITNNETAKEYYEQYQFLAVMDDATTDICIELNEQVFDYGDGPVPPMHYGCRSETVPFVGDAPPTSFAQWLEEQPSKFLDDVFKAGDKTLDNVKVISLDGYRNKIEIILI